MNFESGPTDAKCVTIRDLARHVALQQLAERIHDRELIAQDLSAKERRLAERVRERQLRWRRLKFHPRIQDARWSPEWRVLAAQILRAPTVRTNLATARVAYLRRRSLRRSKRDFAFPGYSIRD